MTYEGARHDRFDGAPETSERFRYPQNIGFGDDRERHSRLASMAQKAYPDREVRVAIYDGSAFVDWVGGTLLYVPQERLEAVLAAIIGEESAP